MGLAGFRPSSRSDRSPSTGMPANRRMSISARSEVAIDTEDRTVSPEVAVVDSCLADVRCATGRDHQTEARREGRGAYTAAHARSGVAVVPAATDHAPDAVSLMLRHAMSGSSPVPAVGPKQVVTVTEISSSYQLVLANAAPTASSHVCSLRVAPGREPS